LIIAISVGVVCFIQKTANDQIALENEQMFSAAQSYIKRNSVEGMEIELKILKQIDNWTLLEVIPVNIETDNALIIMEKVEGDWLAREFGTILLGWEEKIPELFE